MFIIEIRILFPLIVLVGEKNSEITYVSEKLRNANKCDKDLLSFILSKSRIIIDTTLKTMPKSVIGGNMNFLQISAQSSENVSSISFVQFSAIELLFEHIFCFFSQFFFFTFGSLSFYEVG